MQNSRPQAPALKVRPIQNLIGQPPSDVFELKSSAGRHFGFILNGSRPTPSLVVAGSGAAVRSAFQLVLLWPAQREVSGRLALILLDRLPEDETNEALRNVQNLLGRVQDSLFLPMFEDSAEAGNRQAYETMENFCVSHGAVTNLTGSLDCAAI